MDKVEVYRDKAGKWRWRQWAGTRIVADSGQGYTTRKGVLIACEAQARRCDHGLAGMFRYPRGAE